MGALADIYAVARIALDTGTFEAEAGKAADSAGTTMSKRLNKKLAAAAKR